MLDSSGGWAPDSGGTVVGPLDLASRVDEALSVQADAFGLSPEEVGVRRNIVRRHASAPGVRALGATTARGRLAGFVYGMPNDRGHWWSSMVLPNLTREGNAGWLDDAFVITELHVHPDFQQRGIGRHLITALTDGAPHPRSLLSAVDEETPARALYRALGYRDLARRVHFPSAPRPYAVMGAWLPLRR
ncbi:N-acetyltransferase [Streptomyces sp. AJS327]|uniref:GNAT family N-acetyltransferase n=1 Tax=Streptomyces sp. AJS327 TaxID=2545265 RepID=UPI0015DFA1E0|nr:GNAT family N-acetyltransferase [Streptomyces sp. AJS327]MBA0051861.1 N-acetyltransferase [Streptomyces sp. AJS327]